MAKYAPFVIRRVTAKVLAKVQTQEKNCRRERIDQKKERWTSEYIQRLKSECKITELM